MIVDVKDDPFGLCHVWSATLDIYKAFALVCDKYGLRHTLAYGTLLGAVRHGGFIPWDDDFDVHMPREDYERFRRIAYKDLPSFYGFVTSNNTPTYPAFYGKIQETRESVLQKIEMSSGYKRPHGIYIDIFPVDDVPDSMAKKLKLFIAGRSLSFLHYYMFSTHRPARLRDRICMLIGGVVALAFPGILTLRDYIKHCERLLYEVKTDGIEGQCGRYYEPRGYYAWKLPKKSFRDIRCLDFCGMNLPVMADYDSYLRQNFGDYMSLPPKGRQIPSHADIFVADWRLGPTTNEEP